MRVLRFLEETDDRIMRLVDTKFGGIARGVGQARIWGRVHAADIVLGGLHLPCSFQIIEVYISFMMGLIIRDETSTYFLDLTC